MIKIDWSKWRSFKKVKETFKKFKHSRQAKKALDSYLNNEQYILISEENGEYVFEDLKEGVRFKFTRAGNIERMS